MSAPSQPAATGAELFARLIDPAHRHDPYPVYAEIRRRGPLWIEHMPAVAVGSYRDCEALMRDPRLSAERWRYAGATSNHERLPIDAPTSLWQPSFLSLDPPDHTRLRRLVTKAFTVHTVTRLEPAIADLVDRLVDEAADRDTFDVIAGLAYPLPVTVICRMLGVPAADEHLFHRWSSQLARFVDGLALAAAGSDDKFDWMSGTIEMHRYIEDLVALRRVDPRDDLVSDLIAIEDAGDVLTADELVSTIVLLLVTGHETTMNLIGNCVLALLRHPEHLAAVRADPTLVPAVIEETVRYDPPVHLSARVAKEAMDIGGTAVPEGGLVFLLLAAAHRDPAMYPDPDRFDPTRAQPGHLGFGVGIHYCVGAALAKTQTRLALTSLLRRLVDPVLAQDPPPYREHVNLHGPSALPLAHKGIRPR